MKILTYIVNIVDERIPGNNTVETSFFGTLDDAKDFLEEISEEDVRKSDVITLVLDTDDYQEVDVEVEETDAL